MEGSMGEEKANRTSQGGMFHDKSGKQLPLAMQYDYTNFYFGAGDDAFAMLDPYDEWWKDSKPAGYYLYGLPMQGAPTTRVDVRDTKTNQIHSDLLNFASYNYLGLSYRPEVKEAVIEAVGRYGNGASGSPILSGSMEVHHELAERLAEFKGKEAVLLFPTGYSANVGVIAGLMRSGDLIVADQYAHASLVDGMILSKANSRFFRHNKVDDLERKLKRYEGKKLVLIEGVYSMDGDIAVVPDIVEVCQGYGARILIDEAHSTFIYGKNGRGVAEHFGYDDEIDMHIGTFSKSLGGQGGFLAGSQKLINYLRGFSRSRTFSCGLSPVVTAGILKALEIFLEEPELRTKLWENVNFMQKRLRDAGVPVGDSESQVIPLMVRDDARAFEIGEVLMHEGIYLNPVKYPAVPKHRSRFRMSISAAHSREELEEGARIITSVLQRYGICPTTEGTITSTTG
jgi:8-amino-7-oxononanoate synthase